MPTRSVPAPAATGRAAVLGRPVAHSLSPALHRAAYAYLGLGWTYEAVDVGADELAAFVASLDEQWRGLSLTMPLKRAVLPLLDEVSPLATAVGAVNTVVLRPGHRFGDNTDVEGLAGAVRAGWPGGGSPTSAVVLGGGATGCSALASLRALGIEDPTVYVRRPGAADELRAAADRLGVRPSVVAWEHAAAAVDADVVVSVTPAGATDALAAALAAGHGALPLLVDVVYHPWPTALAAAWARRGGAVVGGLEMLVRQARLQVLAFAGLADGTVGTGGGLLDVMRAAALAAVAAPEA